MMDARSLGPDDLISSSFTLAGRDMAVPTADTRVRAAAMAGYAGLGMMTSDYDELRASGRSDADLRAIVDNHGSCVAEVEFLSGWWLTGDEVAPARQLEEKLFHMVDVFGARHVCCAAGPAPGADIDQTAEALAALADRAAAHGARVGVGLMGIAASTTSPRPVSWWRRTGPTLVWSSMPTISSGAPARSTTYVPSGLIA
jgi:sugar phosphate isomerase/epimerase